MRMIYVVHIAAASLGLLSGYVALYAAKGAALHRRSGMVFVYTMLTMCVAGATLAIVRGAAPAGIPAFPFFMFGTFGLLARAGDIRLLRNGPLTGARRIARHLWRMSYALLIAALSFFIGQAKAIPKPVRIFPLLVLPVLAVLVTMLYWLWRVRVRRSLRGFVGITQGAF